MNSLNLDIEIDADSPIPVYEQIKEQIKLLIISEEISIDDKLPPIRELAKELEVNQNTIVKVYYQLDVEGFLYAKKGTGYFVKERPESVEDERFKLLEDLSKEYLNKVLKLGYTFDDIIKMQRAILDVEDKHEL